jgi:hypothetical protein
MKAGYKAVDTYEHLKEIYDIIIGLHLMHAGATLVSLCCDWVTWGAVKNDKTMKQDIVEKMKRGGKAKEGFPQRVQDCKCRAAPASRAPPCPGAANEEATRIAARAGARSRLCVNLMFGLFPRLTAVCGGWHGFTTVVHGPKCMAYQVVFDNVLGIELAQALLNKCAWM